MKVPGRLRRVNARLLFATATAGAVLSAALLLVMLHQAVQHGRIAASESTVVGQLSQLRLGIHGYHDEYGKYPPAWIVDQDGTPLHSWRALILPWIEERALERAYRFDEPWNGPHNILLEDSSPYLFRDRRHRGKPYKWTNVVALVGPYGVLSATEGVSHRGLRRRAESTILLVYIPTGLVQWSEPRDLPLIFADAGAVNEVVDTPFSALPDDPIVLFADNRCFKIRRDVNFADVGDRTRRELLRLGIVYPTHEHEPLSLLWSGLLVVILTVCLVVGVKAAQAIWGRCE